MTSTFMTARRARVMLRVRASEENPYEGAENPEEGLSESVEKWYACV